MHIKPAATTIARISNPLKYAPDIISWYSKTNAMANNIKPMHECAQNMRYADHFLRANAAAICSITSHGGYMTSANRGQYVVIVEEY